MNKLLRELIQVWFSSLSHVVVVYKYTAEYAYRWSRDQLDRVTELAR